MSIGNSPEPWLRGPIEGVHPLVMPVFFSFAQVHEDLAKYAAGLSDEVLWREIDGASLGFHLKHMAESVDRLTTYLMGGQLSPQQFEALKRESEPQGSAGELLAFVDEQLVRSENQLRQLDPATLYDSRAVGRRALPATVLGLIVHLCEHTQRHLGQAITLAKMLRQH
ncbi:MAG: DinB family protein [Acidobacteriaceae bacterium]|nr:DinB family protein [Acidobacteriaceae bacterium]